ncbi:hypothetical protein Q644_18400 [Brucella intermedia 229E]|uniref:Uncharacterized protein n=1 Tax=Brucella intermedia 229E TaxID=1337887 RepID=U4V7Y7_9HYPH|nr:hypothetical protein Q644_18400 [Brucella intermedia 229E]
MQNVTGDRLPVGAATALLGGPPVLLWMLPRLRMFEWPSGQSEVRAVRLRRTGLFFGILLLLVLIVAAITLGLGRSEEGFVLARGELFDALFNWRAQRLALAGLSGGMLALAGAILQRMTGNTLASPEILASALVPVPVWRWFSCFPSGAFPCNGWALRSARCWR